MADGTSGAAITERAQAFLAELDDGQRERAMFGFPEDEQRRDWAYFPRDHAGLPLHDMTRGQRMKAHGLIAAGLSVHAHAQVTTIMGIESVLNVIENERLPHWRDPGRYFVSVFGTPGEGDWGWRLEGHHVNLNYTFAGGELAAVTPLFLGSNPASIRHGDVDVVRPCAEEEDTARELMASLDGEQRAAAMLSTTAPFDFVLVNAPDVPERQRPGEGGGGFPPITQAMAALPDAVKDALAFDRSAPTGLPAARMSDSQRDVLRRLVRVYVDRVPASEADARFAAIDLDALHFAWAGSLMPREAHYYRVQGGQLLIECDNTQDNANHVHTVWRDAAGDFGMDALRSHIARDHV